MSRYALPSTPSAVADALRAAVVTDPGAPVAAPLAPASAADAGAPYSGARS